MTKIISLLCLLVLFPALPMSPAKAAKAPQADVVVYKANPGGIIAAVAAAESGSSVILLEPTAYVGGIMAQGGLCASDVGNSSTIGGWSQEFFREAADYYRTTYGADSPQYRDCIIGTFAGGHLEPKVAEMLFEKLLANHPTIQVIRKAVITGVKMKQNRIETATCAIDGKYETISGKVYIDASYTGDLMALAKAPFCIGSESVKEYGETLGRSAASPAIQAFNYRVTLAKTPTETVPVPRPDSYDPAAYSSVLQRLLSKTPPSLSAVFFDQPYWGLPNNKQDTNIGDLPGKSWDYPLADANTRLEIEKTHRNWLLGMLYFVQNDPAVPQSVRDEANQWGLPKDEFVDNGNFPREIYIREARRLQGAYLMKQSDIEDDRFKPDTIALGSYAMDCHSTEAQYTKDAGNGGFFVPTKPYEIPYRALVPKLENCSNLLVPVCLSSTHVAWASLRMEPVFMMTGEAAGRAAALAALSKTAVQNIPVETLQKQLRDNKGILDVAPEAIAEFDWAPKQPRVGEVVTFRAKSVPGATQSTVWHWSFNGGPAVDSADEAPQHQFTLDKSTLVTLVVEDAQGRKSLPICHIVPVGTGAATDLQLDSEDRENVKRAAVTASSAKPPYYGRLYYHDNNALKGKAHVTYAFPPVAEGTYAVYISSTTTQRATDAKVIVDAKDGIHVQTVDENTGDPFFGLIHVGDFLFGGGKPPVVTISNEDSHGIVVFDIVRCVLLPPAGER
ncbi:MAG: FAD-dependent oxidoreductase [Capsulimonadaceae bacterium]|nr:FAD-dependent oxidoreductase [Capsulimonadaceae bacterium]